MLTAANGPESLAIAAGYDVDIHLLVTDVVMPKMLGKEVAARIREFQPDFEVLYMSGYAQPVLASQGRLEPGVALVDKPFSEAALITKGGAGPRRPLPRIRNRRPAMTPPWKPRHHPGDPGQDTSGR